MMEELSSDHGPERLSFNGMCLIQISYDPLTSKILHITDAVEIMGDFCE